VRGQRGRGTLKFGVYPLLGTLSIGVIERARLTAGERRDVSSHVACRYVAQGGGAGFPGAPVPGAGEGERCQKV
jgi:hypothetical protein